MSTPPSKACRAANPKRHLWTPLPPAYGWIDDQRPLPRTLQEARKLFGTKEVAGSANNPVILGWAKEVGLAKSYNDDAIPWCGLFWFMADARQKLAAWQADYNQFRPHTSLGGLAPQVYARNHSKDRARRSRPASPELRNGSTQRALTTNHKPTRKANRSSE
jgi:hypothetical protein